VIRDRHADFGPTLACEKLRECRFRARDGVLLPRFELSELIELILVAAVPQSPSESEVGMWQFCSRHMIAVHQAE